MSNHGEDISRHLIPEWFHTWHVEGEEESSSVEDNVECIVVWGRMWMLLHHEEVKDDTEYIAA